MGIPLFKTRHRAKLSVRFTTGAIRAETKHVVLPRLGRITLHEDSCGLVDNLDAGTAWVIAAAVGV